MLVLLGAVAMSAAVATRMPAGVRAHRQRRDATPAGRPGATVEAPPAHPFRLSVVVPSFREESIGRTVQRLRAELADVEREGSAASGGGGGVEIVVVDDGSGDDTADLAAAAGADQVVRLPVNRGKGAAVRAGVLAARGGVIAFTDADLSYAPAHLLRLLAEVEGGWDVVVGNRHHPESTTLAPTSHLRVIGSRGINALTRLVLTGRYPDTQCGLKAFRADAARSIFGSARLDGFAFDVEVLHLVERAGWRITDVPVEVENSARSTVNVGRDAVRLARDLLRIRRWRRTGVYDRPRVIDLTDGATAAVE